MKFKSISSPNNPQFKVFLKLAGARAIRKHGTAILSGLKTVEEVLNEFPERVKGLIFSEDHTKKMPGSDRAITAYNLTKELFRKIDLHGTGKPLLLIEVPHLQKWTDDESCSGCTLCVPFQDPSNLGAVIRSAAAFGVKKVVLLEEAAHPFLPKSLRASGSSIFRISMVKGPSIQNFKVHRVPVITLSPKGRDIGDYLFPENFYLVPGLEGPGLPEHLKDTTPLAIPMENSVESLNSATAAGIALYIWRQGVSAGIGKKG